VNFIAFYKMPQHSGNGVLQFKSEKKGKLQAGETQNVELRGMNLPN